MTKVFAEVALVFALVATSQAKSFPHPFTVTNPMEVSLIKQRIAAGKEPQKTAYSKLLSKANSALSMSPTTATELNFMSGYADNSNLKDMRTLLADKNANPTYALALAYLFSGDEKYARKAITFLDAWTKSNCNFIGGDAPLQLGSHFSPMVFAADILWECPLWSAANRAAFEDFWRRRCVTKMTYAFTAHNNNWMDNGLMGYLASGITFGDTALIGTAMKVLKTYHTGTWKMTWDAAKGIMYLPSEVVRSEGAKGITYTAYSLTAMVVDFDMARNLGVDLWSHKTENGTNIAGVIQTFFEWNTGARTFPWNTSANKADDRMNSIEVCNTRCGLSSQAKSWLGSHRPVAMTHGELFATLLKGDLDNIPVPDARTMALRPVNVKSGSAAVFGEGERVLFDFAGRLRGCGRNSLAGSLKFAVSPDARGSVVGAGR